ncbi:MAG: GGDEF domain-containing protein, partial [Thiobacillus sp.]|nr:GGDEF domain-containing protein [Thiobacillus sp.]
MNRLHDSHRIGIIGGLILAGLTLASGLAVYVVMQRQAEAILVKSLEASLRSDRRLFESEIEASLANALTVSTRPFVIRNLKQLQVQPDDTTSRVALQQIADSFLPTGFTGITFYDSRGVEVARAGNLSGNPALSVPLNTQVEARLLWDREFVLQVIRDVVDEKGTR